MNQPKEVLTKDLTREQMLLAIKAGYIIHLNKSWLVGKHEYDGSPYVTPHESTKSYVRMVKGLKIEPKFPVSLYDKVFYQVYAVRQIKDKHHTVTKKVAGVF